MNPIFEKLKTRQPGLLGCPEYSHCSLAVPLVEKDGQYHLLFEVRSGKLRSQPGEICFPGGAVEKGESFCEAAVREACEELLIKPRQLELICPLDAYIMPSGLYLHPYLFLLSEYKDTCSPDEVEQVFTISLGELARITPDVYYSHVETVPPDDFPFDAIPGGRSYPWMKGKYSVFMYPEINGRRIWGLTAKVLEHTVRLLTAAL